MARPMVQTRCATGCLADIQQQCEGVIANRRADCRRKRELRTLWRAEALVAGHRRHALDQCRASVSSRIRAAPRTTDTSGNSGHQGREWAMKNCENTGAA